VARLTSYSLVISERATRSIGTMDEIRHDLFVVTMLDLVKDPHGMGNEIEREGDTVQRGLTLGSLGTIVYVVDDTQALVTVLDVLWPRPPQQAV
jgi:hypothetical protein